MADRLTYLAWCNSEGRLRYPEIFSERGDRFKPGAFRMRAGVSFPTTLRLLLLLLSPKSGKALRTRFKSVLRSEGWGGFARRLHGPRG